MLLHWSFCFQRLSLKMEMPYVLASEWLRRSGVMLESPGWKDHQFITYTPTMYMVYLQYIWLNIMVNVGEYTIHGWYGL